jgi:hypothetical protein
MPLMRAYGLGGAPDWDQLLSDVKTVQPGSPVRMRTVRSKGWFPQSTRDAISAEGDGT